MPSTSKKQAKFMAAAAHNPKFAKKAGIKQSVAKDFNASDQLRGMLKKAKGGKVNRVAAALAHVKSMMEEGWDAKDSLRETRKKFPMDDLENDHFEAGLDDLEYNDPFQKPVKKAKGGKVSAVERFASTVRSDMEPDMVTPQKAKEIRRRIKMMADEMDMSPAEMTEHLKNSDDSTKRLKPTVREEGRKTEVTPADEGETAARADVAGRKEYATGGLATLRQAASQLEAGVGTSTKGRSRPSARVRKPRKGMAGVLGDADSSLGSTGNRLADVAQRLAEGGKVGAAALALRQLAKKFESALQMEDHSGARRIAQQMELMEPGSSQEAMRAIQAPVDRVAADKLATFAKGGKVGKVLPKDRVLEGLKNKYRQTLDKVANLARGDDSEPHLQKLDDLADRMLEHGMTEEELDNL